MKKRVFSMFLALIMVLGVLTVAAFAAEGDVARIGDTGYASFADALTAAKAMTGDVTVEIYDKVTLNTGLSGSYDSIKFVGKDADAEIYLDVQGYITAPGEKVAFEDLILSKSVGGFMANAGFMNVAFGVYDVTEVTYTNCTFAKGAYASSGKVTFTGCTFYRSHEKYGLWAYGDVDCTVDGCTFADYRGIKMYAEGAAKTTDLTVKNTDFSDLTGKPAIVLTYGESVTLEGNTYSGTGVFELDLDGAPNGTSVTSDVPPTCNNGACGVLVDGKIYTTVAQAAEVATSGSDVTLLYSTDEAVEFAEGVELTIPDGITATNVTVATSVVPVARIGDTGYATLAEAVAAAKDGETVTVLTDHTMVWDGTTKTGGAYPSFFVVKDKSITLDLNGKNITADMTGMTGTIICFASEGTGHLTIIDEVGGGSIKASGAKAYALFSAFDTTSELTINGGTFELGEASNCLIHSAGSETVTVNGGSFALGNVNTGTNGMPWIFNANGSNNRHVTVTGGTFNFDVSHQYWRHEVQLPKTCYVVNNGNTWTVKEGAAVYITEDVDGYDYYVGYATLAEAVAAAKDGETVELLNDITLTDADMVQIEGKYNVMLNVAGKDITLDLNGKKITVEYNGGKYLYAVVFVADGAKLTVTGNGSIDVPENGINVAYMFWKRGTTGALTIKNGTFHMNDSADSMVYTNGSEIVTVEGGAFTLDAVGTRTNGFPCIFSVAGQNERNIIVTGGTFNADVNHQYWAHEVNVSETLAVKDNGNGTWTVVPAAAYITETAHGYTRKVGYATLAEAVAAAKDGETVYLNGDLNIGNGITIGYSAAKVVTIDLNGFKLTGSGVALTAFRSGTEVTLTNGTVHGNSSGGTLVTTYNGKLILGDDLTVTSGSQAAAIKVNGGKLEVTGENVKVMGGAKGCIILGSEADEENITIAGGTYSAEIPEKWCIEDYGSVKNSDGTYTVKRIKFVLNETTGEKYATIAEAIKAIPKNADVQTLKLLDNTTSKGQFIGHAYAQKVVLDLNGFTLSSTDKTLTVYRSGTEVTIMNGTVSGNTSGGTIQVTYGGKLTLGENVTVKSGGSANAIKVDANSTLIIANESVKVLGGKNDLVVAENAKVEIAAGSFKHPVKDAWCAEGKMPALEKTAEGYYTVMDACEAVIIRNDEIFYGTLAEAIAAAQNNETIKLMSDIAVTAEDAVDLDSYASIFNVDGKTITIDMNGKTISCNAEGIEKMLLGVFTTDNNGHLTLTGNGTVQAAANGANVYALITNYEAGCSIIIENGTYELDVASDCLIYSGASANEGKKIEEGVYSGVIINGGTFELGNVGTGKNNGPWIFNARGQNQRHVWVNGGTFNADINHQYWIFEAQLPETLALQYNEETGMYTVVDAVCYVAETHGKYVKNVGFASLDDAAKVEEYRAKTYFKTGENKLVMLEKVAEQEALNDAVSGSNATVAVTLAEGTYTMPSTNGDITISGTKDTVISGNDATAKNVTFEGVTIQSTGVAYTGIKHSEKVVYNNVTIVGNMYLYAQEVVFENCTFDLSGTNDYIWVYGATNVTFKNCTFNTMGKAILVFQDGSTVDQTVTVEGCTFKASQAASTWNGIHISAVSIDGSRGGTYNVILNNNIVDSDFNGLWQDKTAAGNITVTVDGTTVLSAQ